MDIVHFRSEIHDLLWSFDICRLFLKSSGCKTVLIEPAGFKTPLTDADNVRAACDRAWNHCPPETQEEYSTEYAEDCKLY